MRVPKESLDDFASRTDTREPVPPPPAVSPRLSGEIEVLSPLVSVEEFERAKAARRRTLTWAALSQFSFYHRSLAVGGIGAVVVLGLLMSVYFGFYAQPIEQAAGKLDVIAARQKKRTVTPPKAPNPFDHLGVSSAPADLDEPILEPAIALRSRQLRPRPVRAVYRVRRVTQRPRLSMTKFVPTTLIIYVDKGEVKSRIEPQLTASYKKPLSIPN